MSKNIKQATKQEFIQGTDHFQEIFSKQTRWHQQWTRRDPFYFVEGGAMDFSLITTQIGSYWECVQNKYVLKIYPMLVRKYMTSTVHEHVPDNKKKIVSVWSRANMQFSISWNLQLEPAIWLNTSKAEALNSRLWWLLTTISNDASGKEQWKLLTFEKLLPKTMFLITSQWTSLNWKKYAAASDIS